MDFIESGKKELEEMNKRKEGAPSGKNFIEIQGKEYRHKWKVKRGWIKVHAVADDRKMQIVAICVTNEEVHDNAKFGELVEQSVKNAEANEGK